MLVFTLARNAFIESIWQPVQALLICAGLLALVLLLTVRHRVQASVRAEDIFDPSVVTFGLLAAVLTFVIAGLANYLYRWSFPATFAVVGAVMATVAWALVSCISRIWQLQSPLTDFDPQLVSGLLLVFEAIIVLTAIAIAASTRLGQIATLLVCCGVFLVGLVGEYFLSAATAGREWLRPVAAVVPNLQFFWPADALTQGSTITVGYLGMVPLYTACLVGAAMSLAVMLFQRRDVG
jgi:ABC-2 type transport system permease protein